jgi:hypothetical protein
LKASPAPWAALPACCVAALLNVVYVIWQSQIQYRHWIDKGTAYYWETVALEYAELSLADRVKQLQKKHNWPDSASRPPDTEALDDHVERKVGWKTPYLLINSTATFLFSLLPIVVILARAKWA